MIVAVDEELFFARRLGYGLGRGEGISSGVRDWAVSQVSKVVPLDFYGLDGRNIRSQFPDFAEPTADFPTAAKLWGQFNNREEELQAKIAKMNPADFQNAMEKEVYLPRSDYPYWRDALVQSLTATGGPSPVFERFWQFWVNHFSVNASDFVRLFYGPTPVPSATR